MQKFHLTRDFDTLNVKRINYIIERYIYIYTYYISKYPTLFADISRLKHNRVRVEIISRHRLSSPSSPSAFYRWDTRGAWESKRGRAEKKGREKEEKREKKEGEEIGRKGGFPFLVGTYYETR